MIVGCFFLLFKGKISYLGAFFWVGSISTPLLYFVPNPVVDLSRYFSEMLFVSQYNSISSLLYSYNHIKSNFNNHSFTFIYDLFQWIIARTGFFNLLPFSSVFIVYMCLFIPYINLRNKNDLSFEDMFLGFISILSLFTYDGTSSTVRWYLASGIFFLITYFYFLRNNVKHQFICLLLYIPLIFVHEAMILPIILMVVCTFIKRIRWHQVLFLVLLFALILISIGSSSASGNTSYLGITKIYENMSFSSSRFASFWSALRMVLSMLVPFMYSIISFNMIHKFYKNELISNIQPEINSFIIFNVMDILLIPFVVIFQRYVLFVGMFDIITIMEIERYHGYMSYVNRTLYFCAIFLGVIYFLMGIHGMPFNFSHLIFEF